MFLVHFTIPDTLIGHLSIHTYITCIVNDLGTLKIAQRIQIMGSLQDDKLFIVGSWI